MAEIIQLTNSKIIPTFKQQHERVASISLEPRREKFIDHLPSKRITESRMFNSKRITPQDGAAQNC